VPGLLHPFSSIKLMFFFPSPATYTTTTMIPSQDQRRPGMETRGEGRRGVPLLSLSVLSYHHYLLLTMGPAAKG
jgi:hypothetical protein